MRIRIRDEKIRIRDKHSEYRYLNIMFIVQRWLPPAAPSRQPDLRFAGQPPVPAQRVRPPEHCAKSQVIFAPC
jgi:hypothetical protein